MNTTHPVLKSTVGKRGKSVMPPNGDVIGYEVIDEVRSFQDSGRSKVILMQRMKLDSGREEIRVGYYIIGKLPKMKGKWVWGQYAAFIPLPVFSRLILKAVKRGWFPSLESK